MKLLKYSAVALMLAFIVLASSASASGYTTLIGGVTTHTENGGTAGDLGSAVTYSDDRSQYILGNLYQYALNEYIGITADVDAGTTGSADATWSNGPKAFTQPFEDGTLSTSLDGALTVSVDKTSKYGIAHASAVMGAIAGADKDPDYNVVPYTTNGVAGSAFLYSDLSLTGVGSALAEIDDGAATYDAEHGSNVAQGSATGSIKLTASTENDATTATSVGGASGSAAIAASSYAMANGVAGSDSNEYLQLGSSRGSFYSGKSYVDGSVTDADASAVAQYNVKDQDHIDQAYKYGTVSVGYDPASRSWTWDSGNSRWKSGSGMFTRYIYGLTSSENPQYLAWTYYPEVESQDAHLVSVNSAATSSIEGEATSLSKRDTASVNALVESSAATTAHGSATADTDVHVNTQVTRDASGATDKATAEGYITSAEWASEGMAADYSDADDDRDASVAGATDTLTNGQTGFGAGSWILNEYSAPQIAQVSLNQHAEAARNTHDSEMSSTYRLYLNGVKATGDTDDAVGAYGAVADQKLSIAQESDNSALSPSDTAAIEWLEGGNTNNLPGYYDPAGSFDVVSTTGALNRQDTLTYEESD